MSNDNKSIAMKANEPKPDLNVIEVAFVLLVSEGLPITNANSHERRLHWRGTDQNGRPMPNGDEIRYLIAEGYFSVQRYHGGEPLGRPKHFDRSRVEYWEPR